jgi:hypothetical protein
VAGIVLIAVALWGAASALQLDRAYREDQQGLGTIDTARSGLSTSALTSGSILTSLDQAQQSFNQAKRRLDDPLLDPAVFVPVVGRQLRSARALSTAAGQAAEAAIQAASRLRPLVEDVHATGEARVQLLEQTAAVAGEAEDSFARISLGPSGGLLSPLGQKRAELASQLQSLIQTLRQARAATAGMADLLQGPGRYLVLAANNNEMRAGSGMFLDAGVLTTDAGQLDLSTIQPTSSLTVPAGAVPLSGDFAARWSWVNPGGEWRNLAVSPRFGVTGPLAARMWKAATGQDVNGVIVLDDQAIAALLAATGPVAVGGTTVDSSNAVSFLMHDQYVTTGSNEARQDELGSLASAVFAQALGAPAAQDEASAEGPPTSLTDLALDLSQAAAGRHVLLWSASSAQEALWEQAGGAGTIGSNSLLTAVLNIGGNKLDQYLSVRDDLQLSVRGDHTSVTLHVRLANHTPAGQPAYISGPTAGSNLVANEYAGLVALTLPGDATGAWVDGHRSLPVAGRDGATQVLAVPVQLAAGQQGDLVVHFTLPGRSGQMEIEPSARIPAITYAVGGTTFTDADSHLVRW